MNLKERPLQFWKEDLKELVSFQSYNSVFAITYVHAEDKREDDI
jgi:hypothetical protein